MIPENTIENKEKFFALYWNQKVLHVDTYNKITIVDGFWIQESQEYPDESYLELKPLSAISDEDAINVAKILSFHDGVGVLVFNQKDRVSIYDKYNDEPHKINVLHIFYSLEIFSLDEEGKVFQYDWDRLIKCTDYLRLKGYYLGDGTEIDYGWVKLRTE